MTFDEEIEADIVASGAVSPRITPERIEEVIVSAQYHVFPGTAFTVCALTLRNGFIVIGESACASIENFNEEIGRKIAYENARRKIWQLEGYLLRERLSKVIGKDAV